MAKATKPQDPRIFREAVQAALRLDEYDLTLGCDEPFALRFEDDEETWFGVVTGVPGDELGLALVRGPAGLRWIRDEADSVDDEDDLDRYTERIEVVLRPLSEVAPARRPALIAAGAASIRDGLVPEFTAKERNKSSRDPTPREARRITMALHAFIAALEDDPELFETDHPPGLLPTLTLSGDWRAPDVSVELAQHVDDLGRTDAPVRRGLTARDWPVVPGRWSVAVVDHALPSRDLDDGAAEDAGAGLGPVPVLLVVDTDARTLVGHFLLIHRSPRRAARVFARGLFISPHGRFVDEFASHLTFLDPALRDLVAEALAADGVTCVVAARDEAIEHVHAHLEEILDEAAMAVERGDVPLEVEEDADDEAVEHEHGPGCSHG